MMDKKYFSDFMSKMGDLDDEQYKSLKLRMDTIKLFQAEKLRMTLEVGDRVKIAGGKKLNGAFGTIKKVNRTRAQVNVDGDLRTWNVPLTLISRLGKN